MFENIHLFDLGSPDGRDDFRCQASFTIAGFPASAPERAGREPLARCDVL